MNEEKFTGKAAIYAKYRPSYPTAVVERLYERMSRTPAQELESSLKSCCSSPGMLPQSNPTPTCAVSC